jgi:hypothetical protein
MVLQEAEEGTVVVKGGLGGNRLKSRPKWLLAFTLHNNPQTAAHRCPGEESNEPEDNSEFSTNTPITTQTTTHAIIV